MNQIDGVETVNLRKEMFEDTLAIAIKIFIHNFKTNAGTTANFVENKDIKIVR